MEEQKWNNPKGRIQVVLSQYTGCILAEEDVKATCEELSSLLEGASVSEVTEALRVMQIADTEKGQLVARNITRKPKLRRS